MPGNQRTVRTNQGTGQSFSRRAAPSRAAFVFAAGGLGTAQMHVEGEILRIGRTRIDCTILAFDALLRMTGNGKIPWTGEKTTTGARPSELEDTAREPQAPLAEVRVVFMVKAGPHVGIARRLGRERLRFVVIAYGLISATVLLVS